MTATNQYMEAAADTIYELSSDENIRELCRRRAEYEAYERHNAEEHARKDALIIEQGKQLAEKESELAEMESALAEKDNALAEKDNVLAEKDSELAEKDSEIARLRALLEK